MGAEHFAHRLTDKRDGFVCLLCSSRLARTDCPNGFVCDDDFGDVFNAFQAFADLGSKHFFRLARFSLFQGFADADDGGKPCIQSGESTLVHRFIRFCKVLSAFAVADDYVFYVVFEQHCRGDFPRVRAFFCEVYVLCTEFDVRAFNRFCNRRDIDCGYAYDNVAVCILHKGSDGVYQRYALRCGIVHFPVACNNRSSHSSFSLAGAFYSLSFKQAIPGSTLPSNSSSDAPPPVEIWLILSA